MLFLILFDGTCRIILLHCLCPLKNKNGCQAGGKATEETVSKYAVFCTKFLRCAIETLKKVKANQKGLFEVTDALKLGKMKHVKIFSCCLGVRSVLSSQKKLNVLILLKWGQLQNLTNENEFHLYCIGIKIYNLLIVWDLLRK